ncbi:tRNA-uridine aminocarboxypropyltransferase 1 [Prorops nasuta]|uniref:tRNA-uridine aminocarboxypropyltransferase 1 n=1 Tax=Prorops nasuta TaxID=863751 RepID=UPI0034CFDA86
MSEVTVKNTCPVEKLVDLEEKQRIIDRNPFKSLKIDEAEVLNTIEGREICGTCYKSRKFFCYTCYTPVIDEKYIPRVKLPFKIDIIKHAQEIDGKSTAIHAAVLAPEDVCIYTYPDFPEIENIKETILIFPSKTALTVEEFLEQKKKDAINAGGERSSNGFPLKKAIFIDSTWHQTKSIYKDQRLRDLQCVVLKSRISQFWRNQKKSPRWYLATIEAIHQFLFELHTGAYGAIESYADTATRENVEANKGQEASNKLSTFAEPYKGQYDNLLYFFKYMYEKIHTIYDHDQLRAYKRPLM